MNTTPGIVLRSMSASLGKAGIPNLPAALAEKLELVERVSASNAAFEHGTEGRLTTAVAEALIAGTDPAADSSVVEALAHHQLCYARSWDVALADWRDGEKARLLREWRDRLIAEWGGHVATAGKRLAGAARNLNLGTTLDEQSQNVLRVGGKAAAAWHEAYLAVGVIDNAVDAQSILIAFCESRSHANTALLACPALTAHESALLPDAPGRPGIRLADAWTLTCQGHTITGSDYDTYKAARIRNDDETAAGRKAEEARQERARVTSAW
ncbi:MAG TPA: hypothetical protein VIK32_04360 [Candidatus Limnocylindrales bacterium]